MDINLTSKDSMGRILVDGNFDICNKIDKCDGSTCHENCIINKLIQRVYELGHQQEGENT